MGIVSWGTLPVWLVLVALLVVSAVGLASWLALAARRRSTRGALIRLMEPTPSAAAAIAGLRSFSVSEFQARLTELCRRVAQAWSDHRLGDLGPVVTVDMLASWTADLPGAPMPLLLPVSELSATIVEAGARAGHELVTVSLDGGEHLGLPALQYWTLERASRGAGRPQWVLARVESPWDWSTRKLAPGQDALEMLDAIAAADPAFDPEVFTDRVMALYPRLAQAIRDPSCPLALVAIAPPLRRGLATLQAVRARLGRRAVIDSVSVSGVAISFALHGADGDAVTVDVAGTAARYEVDRAGRVVKGTRTPERLVDRWTFVRAAGMTTSAHGGVLVERCPACGAPAELDDAGRCRHCQTDVTVGAHDWVLSRITAYAPVS